jgi:glycosyltransferase involved in cell wall biosynthesis
MTPTPDEQIPDAHIPDAHIEVSVVIPALNAAHCIGVQLEALARQEVPYAWEVVVADNGSTDGTADVVKSFADRLPVRVATAPERGHARARNAGARAACGRKLVFCDADDEVGPGWVVAMAAELDRSDLVGGYVEDASLNDADSQQWRRTQNDRALPTKMGFLPLAITANIGIRADVLQAIGGFNETYGEGCGDVEVCWRAQVKGFSLGYAPDAVVSYRYRTSVRGMGRQMYARGRAEPQLYRDFRPYGVPKRKARETVRSFATVVVHLPDVVRGKGRRGRWVKRVCLLGGRLRGSIEHRTFYI